MILCRIPLRIVLFVFSWAGCPMPMDQTLHAVADIIRDAVLPCSHSLDVAATVQLQYRNVQGIYKCLLSILL